jgi:hypothetical protein
MVRSICIALAALAAGAAAAQEARPPDPADSKAKVPPPAYRSAFTDYRPFVEPQVIPWRESNEQVKRKPAAKSPAGKDAHGGHR